MKLLRILPLALCVFISPATCAEGDIFDDMSSIGGDENFDMDYQGDALSATAGATHLNAFGEADFEDDSLLSPRSAWTSTSTQMSQSGQKGKFIEWNPLWTILRNKGAADSDVAQFSRHTLNLVFHLELKLQHRLMPASEYIDHLKEILSQEMDHPLEEPHVFCRLGKLSRSSFLPTLIISPQMDGYNTRKQLFGPLSGQRYDLCQFKKTPKVLTVGMVKKISYMVRIVNNRGNEDSHDIIRLKGVDHRRGAKDYSLTSWDPQYPTCFTRYEAPRLIAENKSTFFSTWYYCLLTQDLSQDVTPDTLLDLSDRPTTARWSRIKESLLDISTSSQEKASGLWKKIKGKCRKPRRGRVNRNAIFPE